MGASVFQAWLVAVAAFVCNGLVLGLNNAYGVIFARLVKELQAEGDPNAASKAGEESGGKPNLNNK